MVNIIAAIPPAIGAPFHPPTEALQHDNLIKPIIPKTEVIASYTKLRDDDETPRFSSQMHSIVQDENEQMNENEEQQQQQQTNAEQRRLNFFSKKGRVEDYHESKELEIMQNFGLSILVIQGKYNSAVRPILDPTIDYFL
ncbi:MAG: hypothetical protein V5786_03385 [Psychromonas sp.]